MGRRVPGRYSQALLSGTGVARDCGSTAAEEPNKSVVLRSLLSEVKPNGKFVAVVFTGQRGPDSLVLPDLVSRQWVGPVGDRETLPLQRNQS